MKMEVRKINNTWYVVEVTEKGIRVIAGFGTKKVATAAMESYKTRSWAK